MRSEAVCHGCFCHSASMSSNELALQVPPDHRKVVWVALSRMRSKNAQGCASCCCSTRASCKQVAFGAHSSRRASTHSSSPTTLNTSSGCGSECCPSIDCQAGLHLASIQHPSWIRSAHQQPFACCGSESGGWMARAPSRAALTCLTVLKQQTHKLEIIGDLCAQLRAVPIARLLRMCVEHRDKVNQDERGNDRDLGKEPQSRNRVVLRAHALAIMALCSSSVAFSRGVNHLKALRKTLMMSIEAAMLMSLDSLYFGLVHD